MNWRFFTNYHGYNGRRVGAWLFTVHSAEREIEALTVNAGESDVTFLIEPRGAKPYSVVVPLDTPPDQIDDSVKEQISSAKALATRDTHN